MRLAALSVDLDEIACYTAIHGLGAPDARAAHAIYERALPRFETLFEQLSVRATFFAIGSDLTHEIGQRAIARLFQRGHEIGNHTLNHDYDFSRREPAQIRAEIEAASRAIQAVTGTNPRGFRAPGYTINARVFEQLAELGLEYDSSVFPCPSYYAAKAAAISAIALRGRRSHSIVDDPRVLSAPADPYRIGDPYYRRGDGILELPIGVTRDASARLPFIGTFVCMASERGAARFSRMIAGRPLVNLELHGIDLADAEADGLAALLPHQRDLRRPLEAKRRALESAIWALRGAGYEFVTLGEAASVFGAAL